MKAFFVFNVGISNVINKTLTFDHFTLNIVVFGKTVFEGI